MDEVDCDNVTAINASEDAQRQGKETDFLPRTQSRNMWEEQEAVIPREGSYPKSTVQDFMDLLGGKSTTGNLNLAGKSRSLCSSLGEVAEDRVQELTLENYSAIIAARTGNESMETSQSGLSHVNHPTGGHEVDGSNRHNFLKGKVQTMQPPLSQSEMERRTTSNVVLPPHPLGQNQSTPAGQSSCVEHDAVLQNSSSLGGLRTKVMSRSGFSEYFVKSTLKGKGVLCRGQPSPTSHAKLKSQKPRGAGLGSLNPFNAPVQLEPRPFLLNGSATEPRSASFVDFRSESEIATTLAPTGALDAPRNARTRPTLPTSCNTVEPERCVGPEGCGENNLREWIESRHDKLHKTDSLAVFSKILDQVDSFHSKGKIAQDLWPSCFKLLPSKEVEYSGRLANHMEAHMSIVPEGEPNLVMLKRPPEQGICSAVCPKQQKLDECVRPYRGMPWSWSWSAEVNDGVAAGLGPSTYYAHEGSRSNILSERQSNSSGLHKFNAAAYLSSDTSHFEEKWYQSPEERLGMGCTTSSNIYSLGVFLFELLGCFDSEKVRASAMSDLHQRILPPSFLSENPKEAGFCLWLLHPEPSLRPTTRDILQSEVVSGFKKLFEDELPSVIHEDETESELLLDFLSSVKEQKDKHASKLARELRFIEADIKEAGTRRLLRNTLIPSYSRENSLDMREKIFFSRRDEVPDLISSRNDSRLLSNVNQLEAAYFSVRSQIPLADENAEIRPDTGLLKNREHSYPLHTKEGSPAQLDRAGAFFDGLCKYARYTKLEVCGSARDFSNSANVICSLSFDRDEEYFAAAGVSKKVKIFEFQALCDESVDIHYPVTEMSNKSRLSCISWNSYIHNYLASTDYDGAVKLWDATTGQEISEYTEHEKRAWSVDFSRLDPTKVASGSDDCSVKLWSINERNSSCSIRSVANVCCVQFSPHSSHLLAFGSADYKIYCYDIRNANVPWCTLAGHQKAVSYVKFLDAETLVSASTDNTLKLWDLKRSSAVGFSTDACNLTFKGHTNEKNFVGLSVADGYIACGSETNEVFTYHNSLPMPVTSHKFGSIDPVTGKETDDTNGQFVSSVCWRNKSNMIVSANSSGSIKVLKMV